MQRQKRVATVPPVNDVVTGLFIDAIVSRRLHVSNAFRIFTLGNYLPV